MINKGEILLESIISLSILSIVIFYFLNIFSNNLEYNKKINKNIFYELNIKNAISHLRSMDYLTLNKYIVSNKKFKNTKDFYEYIDLDMNFINVNKNINFSLENKENYINIKINDVDEIYIY